MSIRIREALYPSYGSLTAADDMATRLSHLRSLVRKSFPRNSSTRILDLGCGDGALGIAARIEGFDQYWGVDISQSQVERARAHGLPNIVSADVGAYLSSLEPESFDVATSIDLVEHFTKDELLSLAEGVYSGLRAEGRWLIRTDNGNSPFHGGIRYGDLTHEETYTPASIAQLLHAAGFARIMCWEDAPTAHGVLSATRLALWRLIHAGCVGWRAIETGELAWAGVFTRNMIVTAEKPARLGSLI